jgi:hypothetical protein
MAKDTMAISAFTMGGDTQLRVCVSSLAPWGDKEAFPASQVAPLVDAFTGDAAALVRARYKGEDRIYFPRVALSMIEDVLVKGAAIDGTTGGGGAVRLDLSKAAASHLLFQQDADDLANYFEAYATDYTNAVTGDELGQGLKALANIVEGTGYKIDGRLILDRDVKTYKESAAVRLQNRSGPDCTSCNPHHPYQRPRWRRRFSKS